MGVSQSVLMAVVYLNLISVQMKEVLYLIEQFVYLNRTEVQINWKQT